MRDHEIKDEGSRDVQDGLLLYVYHKVIDFYLESFILVDIIWRKSAEHDMINIF